MNGYLNVLKPPGMSSAAVVSVVRRRFGVRTRHAGTLDPQAAGVLPVMLGKATRFLDYFSSMGKQYIAHVSFTGATDTQDAGGTLIQEPAGVPDEERFVRALARFTGEIVQKPSKYCAVKRDGVPLYALARKGVDVSVPERTVVIDEIALLASFPDGYLIRVTCSGGTYIRTLCHDLGQFLGCPAHMRFLLRSRAGWFRLENAVRIEEITEGDMPAILPMDYPLKHYRRYDLRPEQEKAARNGLSWVSPDPDQPDGICRVYLGDAFAGLASSEAGVMKMKVSGFV